MRVPARRVCRRQRLYDSHMNVYDLIRANLHSNKFTVGELLRRVEVRVEQTL